MTPSIGRIVHFVPDETTRKALGGNHLTMGAADTHVVAIIVRVWSNTCVNLKVFGDSPNDTWVTSATFEDSPEPKPHTWHWPPRQ
jgi:hypothetical protein